MSRMRCTRWRAGRRSSSRLLPRRIWPDGFGGVCRPGRGGPRSPQRWGSAGGAGHGWDERIIELGAGTLTEALDRPDFREAVGDLVDEVLASYREKMGTYPRILIGLADIFGLIDRDRLVSALHVALKRVAEDP